MSFLFLNSVQSELLVCNCDSWILHLLVCNVHFTFFLYRLFLLSKSQSIWAQVSNRVVVISGHGTFPFLLFSEKEFQVSQFSLNISFAFVIVWLLEIYLHINEPKPCLSNWAVIVPLSYTVDIGDLKDSIEQKRILLLSSTHSSCLYMMTIKLVLSNNKPNIFYVDLW